MFAISGVFWRVVLALLTVFVIFCWYCLEVAVVLEEGESASPVTFTLKKDVSFGLLLQVYLAVILLYGPCFIVVYLELRI